MMALPADGGIIDAGDRIQYHKVICVIYLGEGGGGGGGGISPLPPRKELL